MLILQLLGLIFIVYLIIVTVGSFIAARISVNADIDETYRKG